MPVAVGIITGSGTYSLEGLEEAEALSVETPFGVTTLTRGLLQGTEVVHVSRHLAGHVRLSNHVMHRANIWALRELGAGAVVGCTVCGATGPDLELGSLVVFDDLHFTSNRLPDGSLCTFFTEAGDPARGHWIPDGGPFADGIRRTLLDAASAAGHRVRDRGAYGHVDGPRFNTPTEIAQLAACGVVAVSQTAGPESVLCGELELPYGLIGFVTNEAKPGEPTDVPTLIELLGRSGEVFGDVLRGAIPAIEASPPALAGSVYRFEQDG